MSSTGKSLPPGGPTPWSTPGPRVESRAGWAQLPMAGAGRVTVYVEVDDLADALASVEPPAARG
jgi:hypothetical protein